MAVKKKASKSPVKKATMAKSNSKKVPAKAPAKKAAAKKMPTSKKAVAKKAPVKTAKKLAPKKVAVPKSSTQKAPAQKTLAQKSPAKKVPVKAIAPVKKIKPEPKPASPVKAAPAPKLSVVKKPTAVKETPVRRPASKPAAQAALRNSMVGPVEIAPYQPGVSEEYMSGEQLEHFRLILNQWKDQLMLEVDSTVGHMKEEAILYPDPLDRAAQEEGFNLELRTRDRERRLIKKIEMSLDKIDNGEYGFCQSCGTEIGLRRLEARPTADKCIDCKTFEEIREKQSGL